MKPTSFNYADYIKLQAENKALRNDRDQWKLAAESSRDGVQPMLRKQIEAKERELAEYRTSEEQGLLIRLQCKVGGDIYWINDEEKCVSVHKNGIRGIVVRNGEFAIEDTDGYIDVAGTKYCYLTREEAEAALAKENAHD